MESGMAPYVLRLWLIEERGGVPRSPVTIASLSLPLHSDILPSAIVRGCKEGDNVATVRGGGGCSIESGIAPCVV